MASESKSSTLPSGTATSNTILVGISGPSSSGKTTIARLLRRIFSVPQLDGASEKEVGIETFIVHEDDFYHTDDKIPLATTPSGELVQDWDTIDAIDVPRFSSALSYVRTHSALPPFLKSKEDLNEITDSGIDDATVERYKADVRDRLGSLLSKRRDKKAAVKTLESSLTVAFVEGFLLYAPPPSSSPTHILRPIHSKIHIPLFLPATYSLVKARREGRSGYVTIGPPPKPTQKPESEGDQKDGGKAAEAETQQQENDNNEELLNQDFWEDPPGYVDDIVWPHYVNDHAWLLEPNASGKTTLKDDGGALQEGGRVKEGVGVFVAPGKGEAPLAQLLEWSVEEVIRGVEREILS